MGWVTQPLRIQSRFSLRPLRRCVFALNILHVLRYHMSPLWGLGYLVYAACYKHVAPLGLNTSTHQNSRHGIHRRGEVTSPDGLGNPTPTHPMVG